MKALLLPVPVTPSTGRAHRRRHAWRVLAAAVAVAAGAAQAAEGMWTFDNLPMARMRSELGWAPDESWTQRARQASVRLSSGCSGAFVSASGLVLSNHHCIVECLSQHTAAGQERLRDGHLARRPDEELRCDGLELHQLQRIDDVTEQVRTATQGLQGEAFQRALDTLQVRLTSACTGAAAATTRCDLVKLYSGGLYHLYTYRRHSDVRLVFAPEERMANFGGDPDNFNFPRHALDMALLRAWDGGQPVQPAAHLQISPLGAADGEPVFVSGNPGQTERGLTAAQLETLRDVRELRGLVELAELRGLLRQYVSQGEAAERAARPLLLGIENAYTVVNGRLQALLNPQLLARKRAEDEALMAWVAQRPEWQARAGGAWAQIAQAEAAYRAMASEFESLAGDRGLGGRLTQWAQTLVQVAEERAKPEAQRRPGFAEADLPALQRRLFSPAPLDAAFEATRITHALSRLQERLGNQHPVVRQILGRESPAQLAQRLVQQSGLASVAARRALWDGGLAAVMASTDPAVVLARGLSPVAQALRLRHEREVKVPLTQATSLIAEARFAQLGTSVYPDATFSLRLSYGRVGGWTEAGTSVPAFTRLGQLFERDTGAAPTDLPERWRAARGRLDAALPFNFVSDNDIVGGSSGSPVLNRDGAVVGLAFDGNLHSIGGDFSFDPQRNRTVMVHSATMLAALREVYQAPELARELAGP